MSWHSPSTPSAVIPSFSPAPRPSSALFPRPPFSSLLPRSPLFTLLSLPVVDLLDHRRLTWAEAETGGARVASWLRTCASASMST
eukprot:3450128-Rhodomonas_salina.1